MLVSSNDEVCSSAQFVNVEDIENVPVEPNDPSNKVSELNDHECREKDPKYARNLEIAVYSSVKFYYVVVTQPN